MRNVSSKVKKVPGHIFSKIRAANVQQESPMGILTGCPDPPHP